MKQLQHKSVKFLCGLGCFPVDNNAVKWGEIQQKKKKKLTYFGLKLGSDSFCRCLRLLTQREEENECLSA